MAKKSYRGISAEERGKASRIYRKRLKAGLIPRPSKTQCAACLQKNGQIERHREDYSFVDNTSIIVLCCRCHRMVHLADRYPEAWNEYRRLVRLGYQWGPTKAIGLIIADNVDPGRLPAAPANAPRESTVLDEIESGQHLHGDLETRRARLMQVFAEAAAPVTEALF